MNIYRHLREPARSADFPGGVRKASTPVVGLPRRPALPSGPIERSEGSDRTLMVGQGINLKGDIESCETLIVEGAVDASLSALELEVRKGGHYKGTAEVREAKVDGTVEGDLTVRGKLTITAHGRVTGKVRYGELAIDTGGRLSGDVDTVANQERGEEVA